jgi:hypothetical protein
VDRGSNRRPAGSPTANTDRESGAAVSSIPKRAFETIDTPCRGRSLGDCASVF